MRNSTYDRIIQYLKTENWKEEIPYARYIKDEYKLIFDTSNYVEIYKERRRVCEGRVVSVDDISNILIRNEIG